ncbi:HK97 family phage prohead protease [Kribbella catacumbae]|uniref:HK97 family phage prohead protease n=1 Tax=Kribbella catacumbae TaxID=460086 RepID=UPI00037255F6|nr:HK97 family phage prohead protease [Kribbella catacumbae]
MTTLTRYSVLCRSSIEGDTLHGHAAVFNQVAKVPGGYEQLSTRAFDQVLKNPDSDPVALINHDPHQLLGRQSSGTLRVRSDDEGLAFEVDLPDTSYANDLRKLVARGDMTGASFGFIPGDDGTWTRTADGSQLHTINTITHLRDVSPVTFPAYAGAGVALRSYDLGQPSGRSQLIRARARALGRGAR